MRRAVVELRPVQYAAATCYFWAFLVFACMVQHEETDGGSAPANHQVP
jgi:hypothetical protein